MLLRAEGLRAAVRAIVRAGGSAEEEASRVAEHLVDANLRGHDSHGVGMIPDYVAGLRSGQLRPNRHARLMMDHGPMVVIDGERGYGQVIGHEAMETAIEHALVHGVCVCALRNTYHLGRIGGYAEQCAEAHLVSMHHVNVIGHRPLVAPFRGTDRRFSTNPYTCALPGTEATAPTVLDMATSAVAFGKVRVARQRGERVAPGALMDARGAPSEDPEVMFGEPPGALRPFGAHKGYALAVVNELLAGAVTGGGTVASETEGPAIVNNMLSVVFDPGRLVDPEGYTAEYDACVAHMKASPPADPGAPVLVPGDPERASRAQRGAHGIEVEEATWNAILAAAESLGLAAAAVAEQATREG